jgi:vitamin B12 transporter
VPHRTRRVGLGALAAILLGPGVLTAQTAAERAAADSALAACAAVSQRRDREARSIVAAAEATLRRHVRGHPRDAHGRVRLARLLTQCRIPQSSFMAAGRLLAESNRLLEEALALEPASWEARLALALNHFHAPEFLHRGDDARRELERLLEQQGERADGPHFALPYLYLGRLHARAGRHAAAVAVWERAARLFPEHEELRRALEEARHDGAADPPPGGADAPAAFVLQEMLVEVGGWHVDDARGGSALGRIDVYTTPGGTADVLQVFQTMPGTTRATEGSDLYVRGGDPAEAPVFVDGARMIYAGAFETVHGGLFGVLDPSVMRRTYFSAGGFSARWGNALSGVLDVETEGRPEVRSWRAGANIVQIGATGRTPLGRAGGAWGSVRASEASLLLWTHGRSDEFLRSPRSIEATAAAAVEPAPGAELKLTALAERDDATRLVSAWGHDGGFRSHGGTRLLALSGHRLSEDGRGLARGTAYLTERTSGFAFGVLERERTDRAFGLRGERALSLGATGSLRAGVEAQRLTAVAAGMEPLSERLAPGAPARATPSAHADASHLGGYGEVEWRPRSRIGLVAGLRGDRLPGEGVWTADPRLAVAWAAGDWVLRAGGGVFHQGRWRTRYRLPDAGAPAGTPRRAVHLAGGVEYAGEPGLRIEAHGKDYDRYVEDGGAGPRISGGRATGIDAIVRWSTTEPVSGWVSWSWLDSRVTLADGMTVPATAAITHTLTGVARASLRQSWQLGATARYGTGRPYTPVAGAGDDGAPAYGAIHGARLPDFFRLDARLTRFIRVPGGLAVAYLETLNVLDRRNVVGYTWDAAYTSRQPIHSFFAARTAVLGMELQF